MVKRKSAEFADKLIIQEWVYCVSSIGNLWYKNPT